MTSAELTLRLKAQAALLGFDRVGIAPALSPPGHGHFLAWLQAGHAAGMEYMRRHAQARSHPEHVLTGVRSVVMASVVYRSAREGSSTPRPGSGKVARYARGLDYHGVLKDKLGALLDWLRTVRPQTRGRAVTDTAPLLERDFARLAGLGWIGKNTMLIDPKLGSFTFLGAILVDCELTPDIPFQANHCGTCTRCLDACPTRAFVGPTSSMRAAASATGRSSTRGPSPRQLPNRWMAGFSAAIFAKTFVRGIVRRRPATLPSSRIVPRGLSLT